MSGTKTRPGRKKTLTATMHQRQGDKTILISSVHPRYVMQAGINLKPGQGNGVKFNVESPSPGQLLFTKTDDALMTHDEILKKLKESGEHPDEFKRIHQLEKNIRKRYAELDDEEIFKLDLDEDETFGDLVKQMKELFGDPDEPMALEAKLLDIAVMQTKKELLQNLVMNPDYVKKRKEKSRKPSKKLRFKKIGGK